MTECDFGSEMTVGRMTAPKKGGCDGVSVMDSESCGGLGGTFSLVWTRVNHPDRGQILTTIKILANITSKHTYNEKYVY